MNDATTQYQIGPIDHGELTPLSKGRCPDCGCIWFYPGPRHKFGQLIECANCRHCYNVVVVLNDRPPPMHKMIMATRQPNCPPRNADGSRNDGWGTAAFKLDPTIPHNPPPDWIVPREICEDPALIWQRLGLPPQTVWPKPYTKGCIAKGLPGATCIQPECSCHA